MKRAKTAVTGLELQSVLSSRYLREAYQLGGRHLGDDKGTYRHDELERAQHGERNTRWYIAQDGEQGLPMSKDEGKGLREDECSSLNVEVNVPV